MLGICNGFQVLCEAGAAPRRAPAGTSRCSSSAATCARPSSGDDLPFTARCTPGQRLVIPVKHGDGCWFAPPELVAELEANRQIVLRYATSPNGSVADVAGVCNEHGNVMGLMPHPEHAVDPLLGSADGALDPRGARRCGA